MRITPKKLWAWAQHYARRAAEQPGVLAVYLSGSLLSRSPLMGGVTDVDLVYIWNRAPQFAYEIRPLPPGAHLDVRHYPRDRFEPARNLRTDPWLGAEVFAARPLWDPQHFFDRLQAGVRSHFHDPEVALQRALGLLESARRLWLDLPSFQEEPVFVEKALQVLYEASHVPAALRGYILPPRRFLRAFSTLMHMLDRTEWTGTVLRLLGAHRVAARTLQSWLEAWDRDFDAALATQPVRHPVLHPARKPYYRRGMEALLGGESPLHALYPLFWTWTQAALRLPPEKRTAWQEAVHHLGWDARDELLTQLDAWMDTLEDFLEAWGRERGIETFESLL